ncbi:hypothetical protein [Quadrisphaera sp. KR29]|uniref:hypothetical protein n=1 Tax=Quadrisphaera sp. KR29 TaxID=3461391 RepID=UPI004043F2EB
MPVLEEMDCPWCAGPQPFEVPPCADGHGPQCPERVCTRCSGALVLSSPAAAALPRPHLAVVA